ncbi:MAG: HD domain-containing protein [Candidatus Gastranaerophilales bacterium]|nr:HD domain-containing protein [Candidatus Gastranaerophilales bacterium]
MNNAINTENSYVEVKDKLISLFNDILEGNKRPNVFDIDALRKVSIAIKAFDLVSISMSMFGYINYKSNKLSYYKTLAILNDARYLATSSHSYFAQKINNFFLGLIEFEEGNYDVSLELIRRALNLTIMEEYDFDEKIAEIEVKIQKLNKKKIISNEKPSFIPEQHTEDPLIALLKVGRTIALETNLDNLLTIIAQEIKLALNADRCTVFLLDEDKKELWSKVALGMNTKEIRFDSSLGLAGHVATTGETVNIKEAYKDSRFNKEIDNQTGYKTESILCMPIRNMSHEIVGVFQVLNKKDGHFTEKDEDLLIAIGSSAGIALENATLFNKQKQFIENQKMLLSSFVDTLSASIDARDKITSGHSKRVTMYTMLICDRLNFDDKQKEVIRQASLLHDIGKIGIRDSVLQKEGKLTDEEYGHIQQHVQITYDILSKIYFSNEYKDVARIASSHHEKFDGSGYFRKLKGENIPVGGRMLAVSDVFDAITSKRHYRSKMPIEKAIGIIIKDSGTHFDKNMTDAFLSIEADKIINVMVTDSKILDLNDKVILNKYTLLDLYTLLVEHTEREHTPEEERFISTFLKYYNDPE